MICFTVKYSAPNGGSLLYSWISSKSSTDSTCDPWNVLIINGLKSAPALTESKNVINSVLDLQKHSHHFKNLLYKNSGVTNNSNALRLRTWIRASLSCGRLAIDLDWILKSCILSNERYQALNEKQSNYFLVVCTMKKRHVLKEKWHP